MMFVQILEPNNTDMLEE